MKKNDLDFSPVSDFEVLDKTIFYLNTLYPCLPTSRLKYHCNGAVASVFELLFYLKSRRIKDYGNNEK